MCPDRRDELDNDSAWCAVRGRLLMYAYLASPYSHEDAEVRDARYGLALAAVARLIDAGACVYSPIVHSHELSRRHALKSDAGFWWTYNRTMIRYAGRMIVLRIDGWDQSPGVAQEMAFAKQIGLRLSFIDG